MTPNFNKKYNCEEISYISVFCFCNVWIYILIFRNLECLSLVRQGLVFPDMSGRSRLRVVRPKRRGTKEPCCPRWLHLATVSPTKVNALLFIPHRQQAVTLTPASNPLSS
jgi:hypothetical protein